MNAAAPHDDVSDEQRRTHRLRFELIFASVWLALGLFLLPALIYWVGTAALGPYGAPSDGPGAGLSTFYSDFFADLADGAGRAWTIALGPLLLICVIRAIFIGVKADKPERASIDEDEAPPRRAPPPKETKRPGQRPARVEPRMGGD